MLIGLIRERKNPPDTRVALSPKQCVAVMERFPNIRIVIESSPDRCYSDDEYRSQGLAVVTDMRDCDVLLGIKEVPIDMLLEGKTYFFFSHTKKMQPYNQGLMRAFIQKRIRMIDYECLTHVDGQRVLGFGFFAGVVGAHNALLTYGKKYGQFSFPKANVINSYPELLSFYEQLTLPKLKIAVTGSGKVASGVIEIMSHLDIQSIEPADFIANEYDYPVYTHLKGGALYQNKQTKEYHREDFHQHPDQYESLFPQYKAHADILINGIYWDKKIPSLFEKEAIQSKDYRMNVIADITCDPYGSVPINVAASTIAEPVYGIDKKTFATVPPFQANNDIVDIMAVDNLPNELPRDASKYFGAHFEKYVLAPLLEGYQHDLIYRATLCAEGKLMPNYEYMSNYAYEK